MPACPICSVLLRAIQAAIVGTIVGTVGTLVGNVVGTVMFCVGTVTIVIELNFFTLE